ncbi:MAG: tRNA uracil 4-sulfurtransferase ThiI [Bdellovibrionota bacterium]
MELVVPHERAILLRYNEIALKGDNRGWFEEKLALNARKMLKRHLGNESLLSVSRKYGRVIINTDWNLDTQAALSHLFGVSSFSPMRAVPTNHESLKQGVVEEVERYIKTWGSPASFRVMTRRTEKALPETSMQIDSAIGGAIQKAFPSLKVNLNSPAWTVGIEVRNEKSYIWTEKVEGAAGLPVGTNGSVLALMSGGLDSPVAAIKALKRGSPVSFIHFYGAPFVGPEVLEKVNELTRLVNRYQPDPKPLWVVPFGKIQESIALKTNPKMRTILYRRLMMRIATEVAKNLDCQALITGESLGQVASQTLENMSVINEAAGLPVLRPLITYDKVEIVNEAKKWGTYETSIRHGVDCCTLFADRHPTIRAQKSAIDAQEKLLPLEEYVRTAVRSASRFLETK